MCMTIATKYTHSYPSKNRENQKKARKKTHTHRAHEAYKLNQEHSIFLLPKRNGKATITPNSTAEEKKTHTDMR